MTRVVIKHSAKVLVAFIFGALVAGFILLYQVQTLDAQGGDLSFIIFPNDTLDDVLTALQEEGFISSKVVLGMLLKTIELTPGGYAIKRDMTAPEIVKEFEHPMASWVYLEEGYSRRELAQSISDTLDWSESDLSTFITTYWGIQWDALNDSTLDLLASTYSWNEAEKESFLIQSTLFLNPEFDILGHVYVPDYYLIEHEESTTDVAEILTARLIREGNLQETIANTIDLDALERVVALIGKDIELLPDIVPLPAEDMTLRWEDGKLLLAFSTIYWNKGEGALELIADPKTKGVRKDIERDVYQRIYSSDGSYRDKRAGTFLWHEAHLHYHFVDFVDFILESENEEIDLSKLRKKSTFCVRDVSKVTGTTVSPTTEAKYTICGKEIQGVSIGWGDTYFHTYVDQNIDMTHVPSGIYTLAFHANPVGRFEELDTNNNISRVKFEFNREREFLSVLSTESPTKIEKIEHVFKDQVF